MRYVVRVNGTDVAVELAPGAATVDGRQLAAALDPLAGTPLHLLAVGDRIHRVVVRRGGGRGQYTLWVDGLRYEVEALDERTRAIRELAAKAAGPARAAPLVAPMPGLVVRVDVRPGDVVRAGQGLIVMEAMKMENELRISAGGTVKAVRVTQGTAVERGAVLVELD